MPRRHCYNLPLTCFASGFVSSCCAHAVPMCVRAVCARARVCVAGCRCHTLSRACTRPGALTDIAWPYYVGVGAATGHMLWQVHTADLDDRWSLTSRFVSNKWTGMLVFAGAVAGKLIE